MEDNELRLLAQSAQLKAAEATTAAEQARLATESRVPRKEYDEHLEKANKWRKADQRHQRRMLVACLICTLIAIGVAWFTRSTLQTLQEKLVTGCTSRNAELAAQRLVYQSFIVTERQDTSQPVDVADRKIESYQSALAALPKPRDCSVYSQ